MGHSAGFSPAGWHFNEPHHLRAFRATRLQTYQNKAKIGVPIDPKQHKTLSNYAEKGFLSYLFANIFVY